MFFLMVFDTEFFFFSISDTAWANFFSIELLCLISFLMSSIEEIIELSLYSRLSFSPGLSAKSISFSTCSLFCISRPNLASAADLSLWILSICAIFWLNISLMSSAFCLKVSMRFWVDFNDDEYFLDNDLTFLYSFSPLRLILLISDFWVVNCFNFPFKLTMILSRFVIA